MVSKSENNQFKNRVKLIIQKSKNKYYNDYFLRNRNNLKETWKMLRNLTSTNQSHNSIKNIVVNGSILSSDTEIAETFNEYFCQLPCNLVNNLPLSTVDPLSCLNIPPCPTLSQFDPVSPTEINIICKGLKKSKQGFDHITVPLFNSTLDVHHNILCEIINLAFTSGIFPDMLKISRIIPIYKKGDMKEISNYRPILILPFISKVFEKCIHSRIIGHFSFHNLFSPRQYGFMRNKCTEDATVELVENLYGSLSSKLISVNIFVDFSKAFDTLNHVILTRKLSAYGFRGVALKLIEDYLKHRKQYVCINAASSSLKEFTIGVPQGSVLGPLLFIIYVNDLLNMSNDHLKILFADDTVLSFKGKNFLDLISVCNAQLELFKCWTLANRLTVNKEKTVFNIISNYNLSQESVNIYFDGQLLSRDPKVKYLGVIFDESLKFNYHIEYIASKISKAVGILYRSKTSLPLGALKTLYYSLVHPYLNYCNLTWGGTFPSHLQPLILLQKRIIRIISDRPFREHTSPLFLENEILKVDDIYRFNLSKYMYKNQDNQIYHNVPTYNLRNRNHLVPHFERLTTTQHSIHYQGPHLWNQLPDVLKSSNSFGLFKKNSKLYFLNSYREHPN